MILSNLQNASRKKQQVQRVGRGPGSKRGKTCNRGHKGDKSRSGYKRREGKEGGQLPLYKKIPQRGFSNVRFAKKIFSINLGRIEEIFEEGDTVSRETLMEKGFPLRRINDGIKILGNGELTKKVIIKSHFITKSAMKKLENAKIEFSLIKPKAPLRKNKTK